jgi:adenylylsulfate kinase-like enzyme
MAEQGFDVVCATISLFHSIQKWNRENIPNYLEIYLRSPLSTLEERDPKGIYARARNGELKDVVGIDLAFEEPQTPDIVLENDGRHSVNSMFEHLSHEISKRALR